MMIELLEQQRTLTVNQSKIIFVAILRDMLDFRLLRLFPDRICARLYWMFGMPEPDFALDGWYA